MNKKVILASAILVIVLKFWVLLLAALIAVIYFASKAFNFVGNGFSLSKRTKHYSQVRGGDKRVFKLSGNSDNPFIQRILGSPIYGSMPSNFEEMENSIFTDAEEKVLGTIWAWLGHTRQGYLMLTDTYIRWIPVVPANGKHAAFKLNSLKHKPTADPEKLDIRLEEHIHIEGLNFHAKGNAETAKQFKEFHQTYIKAILHENAR